MILRRSKRLLLALLLFAIINKCNSLFYVPTSIVYSNPADWGVNYSDIKFNGATGNMISAWLMKSPNQQLRANKQTLLLHFHGNGENRTSHFYSMLWFVNLGYDVISFDYQGYYDTPGVPERESIHFDSIEILKQAIEMAELEKQKFVVYGQSLGGAIALRAVADLNEKSKVKGIVAESTFISYERVAMEQFNGGCLPGLRFLPWLLITDHYSPEETLSNLKEIPLIVIHGERDQIVSYSNGLELYNRYPGSARMISVPAADHMDWTITGTIKKRNELVEFIDSL